MLRQALRESLPSWALLQNDFVGALIMKIVIDRRLQQKLVSTLTLMVMVAIEIFDALESAMRTKRASEYENGG